MAEQGNYKGARERAATRRLRALDMRMAGATERQIASQLGVSHVQIHRDLVAALEKLGKQEALVADHLRALELERLDRMQLPMYSQAQQGNQGAVDRVLRIMERRAKLLGLDAPVKQEITGKGGGPLETAVYTLDQWREIQAKRQAEIAETMRDFEATSGEE